MTKASLSLLAIAVASGLSGCGMLKNNPLYGENGVVRDRGQDYEQAQAAERLKLPPGMRSRQMQERLVVPEVGTTASETTGEFAVPRPEFFYVESGSESVNLKREDGERVLLVDEPIADVWIKLQEFWSFNGIELSSTNPRSGIMETDWITLEGDQYGFVDGWIKRLTLQDIQGPTRNKLRVSLRPDPEDYERTAIRMQHVQYPLDASVADVDWSSTGSARDVEYKSDMMFEMLRYLSKAAEPDSQSLVAMQRQSHEGSQLGRDSRGHPVLKLGAPIDEAWTQLNDALDATEIDVGTRDQATGMIYLTYTTSTPVNETERMGFFEWLHSDREEITFNTSLLSSALGGDDEMSDDPNAIRYSSGPTRIEKIDPEADEVSALTDPDDPANRPGYKIWFAGKVIYVFGDGESGVYNQDTGEFEHTGRYQLKLNRTRSGVFLSVRTDQGLAAPDVIADEILWAVKEHLPYGN
ncbi:MAG: hypothetical protein CMI01_14120 [Oceanospirillaceae bacterium]|nr:hypothetical protein [Oceanospirillaceae bacterium]